jgi:hypothetical protein
MGLRDFPVLSIGENQGSVLAATTSTFAAIPTMSNGKLPKFLYILAHGGSGGTRVTVSPSNASSGGSQDLGFVLDCLWPTAIILNVHGYSVIRSARRGGLTSFIRMYPLEDF